MDLLEQFPILNMLPPDTRNIVLQLLFLVLTLAIIYVLRRVIKALIFAPLKRWSERSRSPVAGVIYEALERPSRLIVFSVGIYITVLLFDFGQGAEDFAMLIARTLLLIAAFVALYSVVDVIFANVNTVENILSVQLEERLLPFLRTVIKLVILIIGGLLILQEFGVNITALLASFGVVGLALSLAAQDTASNIFSFAAIVSDNPFKVGDYISTADFAGTVEHVGVRSTRLRKLDQTLVVVPNNMLTASAVTNSSRLHKRRLDFYLKFEYETTTTQMRLAVDKIRTMLRAHQHVDANSVVVHFVNFGDNSLDVRIIAYIMLADWNAFTAEQEEINLQILDIVASCEIKMGRQSLFIENLPEYDELPKPLIKPASFFETSELKVVPSDVPDQA